jgi:putative Mg2+ transporter-C (MgtC) family protein
VRLLVAAGLGAAVGIERDLRRKPAGIRTQMFICMGSALFTIASGEIARAMGDTSGTRIASNIVQGVGFLGAGAILRDRGGVSGLTSASTIWVMAAVGMAVGGGMYKVASFVVVLSLFALVVIGWVEDRLNIKSRPVVFRVTAKTPDEVLPRTQEILKQAKVQMQHFQILHVGGQFVIEFDADVSHRQQQEVFGQLSKLDAHCEMVHADTRKE